MDCLRIKVPGSARHCPALPSTARHCPGVTGIDRSARECPIYSIRRALDGTTAEHPSPTPPPPAPPCGCGAGWRRCCLREYLPKQAPLRGWSACSRGWLGSGRAAAGQVMVSPHPEPSARPWRPEGTQNLYSVSAETAARAKFSRRSPCLNAAARRGGEP